MVSRRTFESKVFDDGVPTTPKSGVSINKDALVSLVQFGGPSKVFPFFLLISTSAVIKQFDLPDELPSLPVGEEIAQQPTLLDFSRWVDSVDCLEDALFAAQIGKAIFDRLPESYKQKAKEVI